MARLVLFGPAAEAAGTRGDDVPEITVGAVTAWAVEHYGPRFGALFVDCRIWVNGEPAGDDQRVGPDDEVAVLPPFSGG